MISVEWLVVSELVSVALSFVLVYIFLRAYMSTRRFYLLGFPVGFLFLAFSYYFFGLYLLNESDLTVSEFYLWLRVITQSLGFALIAFVYYFSSRIKRGVKLFLGLVLFSSVIAVFLLLGVLVVLPPFFEFPSIYVVDKFFTVVNFCFLGYVVAHLFRILNASRVAVAGLMWTFLAFSLLWFGQYSFFIWGIDRSQTALVFAHFSRMASLAIFIGVFWRSGVVSGEVEQAQQT